MFNRVGFNRKRIGGSTWTRQAADTLLPGQPHVLHVRDSSDTMIGKLTGWSDDSWTERANQADDLKFTIPMTNDLAAYMAWPNQVWLYDSAMRPLVRFVVTNTVAVIDRGERAMSVSCKGLLYQLNKEQILAYSDVSGSPTVQEHLEDWFSNHQTNANPIELGYIHPSVGNIEVNLGLVRKLNFLGMLRKLQESGVGGTFKIDERGKFRWDGNYAAYAKKVVTLRHGMAKYTEDRDSTSVFNRIYVDGGLDYVGRRISVLEAPGYIEDTAHQATHGVIAKRFTVRWARHQSILTAWATARLARGVLGDIKRKAEIVDFNLVWGDADNPTSLKANDVRVGKPVRVVPDLLNPGSTGAFNTVFLKVTKKLSNMGVMSAEMGDATVGAARDIIERLAEMQQRLEYLEKETTDEDDELSGEIQQNISDIDDIEGDILDIYERLDDETGLTQAVKTASADGSSGGAFALKDHQHDGIPPIVYHGTWTQKSDLGNPTVVSIGYLPSGAGIEAGWWKYPPTGTTNSDWIRWDSGALIYDASWTQKSDLGDPDRYAIGYLNSGAGSDEGFWLFPPDGSTNADWRALPGFN